MWREYLEEKLNCVSRECTSSILSQIPLFLGGAKEPKQTCFLQRFLCTLLQAEGKEGVDKAKKEEGNAGNDKSLEDVRAAGCSDQAEESKGDGGQLQDCQAGYLWKVKGIGHAGMESERIFSHAAVYQKKLI